MAFDWKALQESITGEPDWKDAEDLGRLSLESFMREHTSEGDVPPLYFQVTAKDMRHFDVSISREVPEGFRWSIRRRVMLGATQGCVHGTEPDQPAALLKVWAALLDLLRDES